MTTTGAPVLITGAASSQEEQLAARKRKYLLMMSCRIPCLVLAGIFHGTWWLAMAVLAISVPLPWMAVLIANDRPPRKTEKISRFDRDPKKLEAGNHRTIDVS
ncbi:DUF3099 domain-containing protein [Amycolatopsis rifamycinica]|uniref:DUF3099 domain-containing protein n=1 Tax=Amycolatopsis rifamycinica TaxID=287986 RepID=A0A066TSC4_9PSEU|nr:DUF3099 domain-containing protein [Amycolatopsis rifamycinica]KDN16437.1 hypothetical protein DV20_41250 [Amycolatopsis rifamycinica]